MGSTGHRVRLRRFAYLSTAAVTLGLWPASAAPSTIEFVVPSTVGTGISEISTDGEWVVFDSADDTLVPNDTNGFQDLFIRNRITGVIERVNVSSAGEEANDFSDTGFPSEDGRYVAFASAATNLVAGDVNGRQDVFVRDRVAGTTTLVSVNSAGVPVGVHGGGSYGGPITPDGRYVVFQSDARLVPGDTNAKTDIYLRDLVAGTTGRVSVANGGAQATKGDSRAPDVSADGRFVVFVSKATNLVGGDTNNKADIFVRDRVAKTTKRVSVKTAGGQGSGDSDNPSVSADGRYVLFSSAAKLAPGDTDPGFQDVYLRDLVAKTTTMVNVTPMNDAGTPDLSGDGRHAVFISRTPANTKAEVFIRDLVSGTTTLVSAGLGGAPANGDSHIPRVSHDGSVVTFFSFASNLVAGDTNGVAESFVAF